MATTHHPLLAHPRSPTHIHPLIHSAPRLLICRRTRIGTHIYGCVHVTYARARVASDGSSYVSVRTHIYTYMCVCVCSHAMSPSVSARISSVRRERKRRRERERETRRTKRRGRIRERVGDQACVYTERRRVARRVGRG